MSASRVLYGLANAGQAPAVLKRLNRFRIPYVAVGSLAVFMALGYMTLSDSASTVFTWLQDLVAIASLVDWIIVLITYLRFYYGCKAQSIDRKQELPWAAPFQPWLSWISLGMFLLLLLTSGFKTFIHGHWDTETFISAWVESWAESCSRVVANGDCRYFNIPFVLVLYFGYKFWFKTKIIPLKDIPIRGFIDVANDHPEPIIPKATGWRRLNILWS